MATTTATITLSSADLLSDNLSLSATMNLYKGGTTATGLDQFRMERFKIATGTQFDLIEATTAASEDANYVYICNKNTDASHYVIISIYEVVIGRLYAGDWMFIPWSANDDAAEIEVEPQGGTNIIEYCLFNSDVILPTAAS